MKLERLSVRIRAMSFAGSIHTSQGQGHSSSRNNRLNRQKTWVAPSFPPSLSETGIWQDFFHPLDAHTRGLLSLQGRASGQDFKDEEEVERWLAKGRGGL